MSNCEKGAREMHKRHREEKREYTDAEALKERYGGRYAYEWFMRFHDQVNLRCAKDYTDNRIKKITAFVAANTVITVLLLVAVVLQHLLNQ